MQILPVKLLNICLQKHLDFIESISKGGCIPIAVATSRVKHILIGNAGRSELIPYCGGL